jgi:hypothetical protein
MVRPSKVDVEVATLDIAAALPMRGILQQMCSKAIRMIAWFAVAIQFARCKLVRGLRAGAQYLFLGALIKLWRWLNLLEENFLRQ